jgi:Ig-like domain CHU_C associated/Secretion system C-terminal sorting domain
MLYISYFCNPKNNFMNRVSLIIIIIGFAFSKSSFAQITFSKEYGGAYNEDCRWLEQMPDSGFIMTGGSDTYSNGQTDIWLVRTDAYGNTLWTKSIGGPAFDFANMVKPYVDGFVICGVTNRNGNDDAIILKTNLSGTVIWEKVLGGSGIQWFEAFIKTSDGGYAAVGVNTGTGSNGWYDFYLVKFDANGNQLWTKNIGGSDYEIGNSIQETSDGGFILTGQTYSYGSLDGDYYLVKTNSLGVVQWQKTYSQPGIQESHYVQITPDGGFILIGDADDLSNGLGDTDIWMIRTDSLGNIVWDDVYGGTKKDGGKTIENTSDGGFIAAGITRSFGLNNPNYYLLKLDSLGAIEWTKTSYGTVYHDHAYRAIETSDFGFAEAGYFKNSSGFKNYALVKLGPNAGITKDIAVDNIVAPALSLCRSNNVNLSVQLGNYGATNEQNITVNLLVDNGNSVTVLTDTFIGSLLPNATTILNFNQTYDFNTDGVYNLKAYISHRNGDISYSNDTVGITVTVIPPTEEPIPTSGVRCGNGSLTLTAVPAASADSMFWYDAAINGDLVSTGSSFTTPSLNNTTSYYVKSIKGKGAMTGMTSNTLGSGSNNASGHLKFDSRRPFKLVSVVVYPSTAGNRTVELRNSGGTVIQSKTFSLPSAPGGMRIYLDFDVPQGNDLQLGLGSGSDNLFRNNTGAVFPYDVSQVLEIFGTNSSSTTTYYYFYDWYVFVPSQSCESNVVSVQAVIGSSTTNAFDQSRCGNGSVVLAANSVAGVSWYANSSGGSPLSTDDTLVTPSLSSTTTYYLEESGCPNRIAVDAIINAQTAPPAASDVTRCGPGTVTLNATSPDPISWYSSSSNGAIYHTGSTFVTPYLNATTTYYAVAGTICPSTPVGVDAIINSATPPSVTGATACGPASVTLSANSSDPISWFNVSSGGSPIATTNTYTTPVLASPVTYYVEAGTVCPSVRVPVVANVITTDPPVGTNGLRCGAGQVVISAQSLYTVSWWTSPTGGTQLSTGQIFTTPSISSTTNYYAQATNSACNSQRTMVTAAVNITAPPVATSGSRCGSGTVTLTATAADTIHWFSSASGGSPIATGTTFTTPSISTTTTYYAEAGNTCPSTRVSVNAVIYSQSSNPTTTSASRCGTGSLVISAASSDPITWYDAPGGSVVGTGNSFTTPSISSTTTYYAVAGVTGCLSSPVPTVATVNPKPADPSVTNAQHCGASQLTLSASASNPMTWYSQASGGSVLATGPTYTSTFNSTTTVYVESNDDTCSSNRIPVTATINNPPLVNLGPPVVIINQGQTITLDAGAGFSSYLWSNSATTRTINVSTDGTFSVVVTDANNCQGGDTITVDVIYLGINQFDINNSLEVYPNPASEHLTVKLNNQNFKFNLRMYDVTGRIVLTDTHETSGLFNKTYNLSGLSKGVYYLSILSSDGNAVRSIVIQ